MIRAAVLLLCALLPGTARGEVEPPERVRLHKEWLTYLGYFDGVADTNETSAFRAARLAFAADAGVDPDDRAAFHETLKATWEANVRARVKGCREAPRGRALACRGILVKETRKR